MRHLRRGFTLLELIVAIVIVSLLAALAIPTFKGVIMSSKLETAEVTASSYAREVLALAAFEQAQTGGAITKEIAMLSAADLPLRASAVTGVQAATFTPSEGYQVVFGNWEFSGSESTISVKIADEGMRMGVAISVPDAGCALALTEGSSIKSWSVKGVAVENCTGALALTDAIPDLSAPPRPQGLNLGFGVCPDGQPGWMLTWEGPAVSVDLYVNGEYVGVGEFPSACISSTDEDDKVIAIVRNPSTAPGEEETAAGEPSGWEGGAGTIGETLDNEVIELPVEQPPVIPVNPHNPSSPEVSEEIVVTGPAPLIVSWDPNLVPVNSEEIVIIRVPAIGQPQEYKVPAGEEYYYDEVPAGEYTYIVRPVDSSGEPVGPDLPVSVKPVEKPVVNPSGAGPSTIVIGDRVNLAWSPVPDSPQAPLDGYKLYRASTAQGPWVELSSLGKSVTTFSDTSLAPGTYCYSMTAFGLGGESTRTSATCATVVNTPAAPSGVTGSAISNGALISWASAAGVTAYNVYNADTNVLVGVRTGTAAYYPVEGLTNGTAYRFYVKAVVGAIESEPSSIVTVTPTTTTVTFGSVQATETWTVPEGVTEVQAVLVGAPGGTAGAYAAGRGANFKVTLPVTPGEVLNINVGERGKLNDSAFNGGQGALYTVSGGGATDIRRNGNALTDRILVAGGGGGAGTAGACPTGYNAGTPSANNVTVGCPEYVVRPGLGGTQTAGGATDATRGNAGALGLGGSGKPFSLTLGGGGGGGGGYYGGSGGGANSSQRAGGGGGSSFISSTAVPGKAFTSGGGSATIPRVEITY